MALVPLRVKEGLEIALSAGDHSLLIKAIVEEFAPRFISMGRLVYVGDTGDNLGYFDVELLASLGVALDNHGKLPDVVIYSETNNLLFLIESVTSHGPVDSKRHTELEELFLGVVRRAVLHLHFSYRKLFMKYLEFHRLGNGGLDRRRSVPHGSFQWAKVFRTLRSGLTSDSDGQEFGGTFVGLGVQIPPSDSNT